MDYFALFIIYFLKRVLRNNFWKKKKPNKQTNAPRNKFIYLLTKPKISQETYSILLYIVRKLIGSLCKDDDDDGNKNGKKIGLDWQNTNIACASRFLYIPLPSLHDYDVKLPHFTFCREPVYKTTTSFFFFWTLIQSFKIDLQKNSPTSDELNEME